MDTNYIIVQAGGKGSRLEHLTVNKPKALVPVENLPMLFHLFRLFPDKKFIIIGDYHKEVLQRYLEAFATVQYCFATAEGTGTCSGVASALEYVPEGEPFLLMWSDLILPTTFTLPQESAPYLGISQTFSCRWSYQNGIFAETPSVEQGVAGLFLFPDKSMLRDVPLSGELVRWLSHQDISFQELGLAGTREFGILEEYEALEQEKCRPFNRISVENGRFIKEAVDKQGEELAKKEASWYSYVKEKDCTAIPAIHSLSPLTMELLEGGTVYETHALPLEEKRKLLQNIIKGLEELHHLHTTPVDYFSLREAYYLKTMKRLQSVRDLIPYAQEKTIVINGRPCRNVFFHKEALESALNQLTPSTFAFIHGDCTFSNIMLRGKEPVFIDPRGYFGNTTLFGDPNYDWAKLYYSIVGNYDLFNLKKFQLSLEEGKVSLQIQSNQWEALEEDFFALSGADPHTIKLLHAVIWLSLTTYAWQDYDSICGAFYQGLYYLEEVLPKK